MIILKKLHNSFYLLLHIIQITCVQGVEGCLQGLTFVRTGSLSITDEQLKQYIEFYGGRNTSAVSKKTTYLLRGIDPGTSKSRKAEELNIPIIGEQEFWDIVIKQSQKIAQDCGFKYTVNKCSFEQSLDPINEQNCQNEIDQMLSNIGQIDHQDLFWRERQEQQLVQQLSFQQSIPLNIIDKYRPKNTGQLIGIKKIVDDLSYVIRKNKLIELYGLNGTGKTLLAQLVCKELNYQIQLIDGEEDKEELQQKLNNTLNYGFSKQKKCVIVDKADYNTQAFNKQIFEFYKKKRNFPLIFIQNSKYTQQTSFLQNSAAQFQLTKCKQPILTKYIEEICINEKIDYQTGLANLISSLSQGDFYRALILLQSSIEIKQNNQLQLNKNKINSFNNFTKTNTWQDFITNIFMFNKFRTQKQQYLRELQNMFYDNQSNALYMIMQNTGLFTDYNYEFAYENYDYYSMADNIYNQMYKNGQWQAAQAQMTYTALLPALNTCIIDYQLERMFRMPQFAHIMNLSKQQQKILQDFQIINQSIQDTQILSWEQALSIYYILQHMRQQDDIYDIFIRYDDNTKEALQAQNEKLPNVRQIQLALKYQLLQQQKQQKQIKSEQNSVKQVKREINQQQDDDFYKTDSEMESQLSSDNYDQDDDIDDI